MEEFREAGGVAETAELLRSVQTTKEEEEAAAVECAMKAVLIDVKPDFEVEVVEPSSVANVPITAAGSMEEPGVARSAPDVQGGAMAAPIVDEELVDTEAEGGVEVAAERDLYLSIEDCSGELPDCGHLTVDTGGNGGGGDGEGSTDVNKGREVFGGVTEGGLIKCEVLVETVVAPGDEPAWGDVPDEPVSEELVKTEPPPDQVKRVPRCRPKRQRPAPENEDVDEVVQTMRNILMDLRNVDDARLHPEDDEKVRSLLQYHPKAEEKMGSGIDFIKIKRHSVFKDVRCFWVVRTDGTETDFSYHKCLKEKVAKDHPTFVDRYDAVYRAPKRPRQA